MHSTVITQVRAPSLILADPADTLIPVATAHALHDRLSGSQLQLVAYGGHSLPRRNPQAVADAITTFTATLPPHQQQHDTTPTRGSEYE